MPEGRWKNPGGARPVKVPGRGGYRWAAEAGPRSCHRPSFREFSLAEEQTQRVMTMAKPRIDLSAFVGKLLEEQDRAILREGVRTLAVGRRGSARWEGIAREELSCFRKRHRHWSRPPHRPVAARRARVVRCCSRSQSPGSLPQNLPHVPPSPASPSTAPSRPTDGKPVFRVWLVPEQRCRPTVKSTQETCASFPFPLGAPGG